MFLLVYSLEKNIIVINLQIQKIVFEMAFEAILIHFINISHLFLLLGFCLRLGLSFLVILLLLWLYRGLLLYNDWWGLLLYDNRSLLLYNDGCGLRGLYVGCGFLRHNDMLLLAWW